MGKKLNFLYSALHSSYWVYYGVISSFSSVFLLARGFSNSQIGIILAIGNVLAVMIQPYLADVIDRSEKISIFGVMSWLAAVLILLSMFILFTENIVFLAVFYITTFMIMTVMQPFCNGLNKVLEESGERIYFGFCRSIGSLVYGIAVAALGYFVELYSVDIIPKTGILTAALLLLIIYFSWKNYHINKRKLNFHDNRNQKEAEKIDLRSFIRAHKMFLLVNIGVFGLYIGNATVNTFMAQIVKSVGGGNGDVGIVLSVLAFLEVPAMMTFDRYSRKFTCNRLLKFSATVFVVWLIGCTLSPDVATLIVVQSTQLCSLAVFLPAMVKYIDENMRKGEEIKGHTLFTTTTTVAAVVTSLAGGFILDISSARVLLAIASALTIIGAVFVYIYIDKATEESKERNI